MDVTEGRAMSSLDGRIAIVTGAGGGLGREHALLLAAHGAAVVVNDVRAEQAQAVVEEITAAGGTATACPADVTSWDGAAALVDTAVEEFGDLHVLVNNAGIVRDGMLVNLTEEAWDSVVGVHLKGHAATIHRAAVHWRARHKAGDAVNASIVSTTSGAGILNNPGQANYSSAKAGIVALTLVAAKELGRYGVRANAIAPLARTQMTTQTPGLSDLFREPESGFDAWHPGNVSPLVGYLAGADCTVSGAVFHVVGAQVAAFNGWTATPLLDGGARWTVDDLAAKLDGHPALAIGSGGRLPAEGMSALDFQQLIARAAPAAVQA
jgi:NAD(P)-dependent dehydrogenase (short-subunit alcohol dehydrogenase family)